MKCFDSCKAMFARRKIWERKSRAGGLIGICNWHALAEADDTDEAEYETESPGIMADSKRGCGGGVATIAGNERGKFT